MVSSDAHSAASGSPRSWMSSICLRIIERRIPRRRCVGRTPTTVTPAVPSCAPPDIASGPVVAPGGGLEPFADDALRGQLVEEPRREVEGAAAPERARGRVREDEPLLRPGHADIGQPALLLDALLLDRADVRE